MKWITASDIKNWADKKQKHCAETLPELIRRLVFATAGQIEEIDFPSGDSTATGGWDGYLKVPEDEKSPFFPGGESGWEIGADKSSGTKAQSDYDKRKANSQGLNTSQTTYICVTPRSFPKRRKWQSETQKEGVWRDVRVLAADALENWLDLSPAVALWLARQIGNAVQGGVRDWEDVWQEWSLATSPQMTPDLVIAGRTKEVEQIQKWIAGRSGMLSVQGDSPDEPLAFLYASIENLPEIDRVAALARCVVVDNLQEFRAIQAYKGPLLIVAQGECVSAAGAALAKGHQVYISMDATVVNIGSNFLKLSRPLRESVETALKKSSISALDAQKLSRDFGRSIPVIRRNLSISNVVRNPVWSSPEAAGSLLPALLAGSWSEDKEGDRKVLETLASMPYEQFSKKLAPFLSVEDTPLRKVGPIWAFKSPLDAWFLLARHLNNSLLDLSKQAVHSVLTETDPKYELSPENRWAAAIYGKVSQFSEWLRGGLVDSLVLLAVYGDRSPHVKSTQAFVDIAVNEIFGSAQKWESWSSLKDVTPVLAEAAPESFLGSLDNLIKSNPVLLQELLKDDDTGFFGECRHSGLLWALESLAWSSEYFLRAVTILSELMKLDPSGKWSNRPENSLYEIFLPAYPQTHATPEERLAVLEKLAIADAKCVWKFTQKYFTNGVFSESHTFRWRDAGGIRRGMEPESNESYQKYMAGLLPSLYKVACAKENIGAAVEKFARFPVELKQKLLDQLLTISPESLSKTERDELLKNLREELHWINSYGDDKLKAYGPDLVKAMDRFQPQNVFERVGWLLNDSWPKLPEGETDNYDLTQKKLDEARGRAAREILDSANPNEILNYASTAKYVGTVGYALGKVIKSADEDAALLDAMAERAADNPGLIIGYSSGRVEIAGFKWPQEQIARLSANDANSAEVSALILNGLPEGAETWSLVAAQGKDVEQAYWRRATGRARGTPEVDLSTPVQKLLDAERPVAALELAGSPKADIPADILIRLIKIILAIGLNGEPHNPTMIRFYLGHVFKQLHNSSDISLNETAALEWPFVLLFDEMKSYTSQPFAVHRLLQQSPKFFAELVGYLYKRDDGTKESDEQGLSSEQAEMRANNARKAFDSWHLFPGLQGDGKLNEKELFEWVEAAREACAASRHIKGGDLQIGALLSLAPIGSDGIWPDIAVRNLIEHLKNDIIEQHIPVGIYNSRGVTQRNPLEGGTQERKLANDYTKMSKEMRIKWPRTAAMLRTIAESYDRDAKREDLHAELNELRWG